MEKITMDFVKSILQRYHEEKKKEAANVEELHASIQDGRVTLLME